MHGTRDYITTNFNVFEDDHGRVFVCDVLYFY